MRQVICAPDAGRCADQHRLELVASEQREQIGRASHRHQQTTVGAAHPQNFDLEKVRSSCQLVGV